MLFLGSLNLLKYNPAIYSSGMNLRIADIEIGIRIQFFSFFLLLLFSIIMRKEISKEFPPISREPPSP
jgi:hypothetical protein